MQRRRTQAGKYCRWLPLPFWFLFLVSECTAQEADFQTWYSFTLEKPLAKRWKLLLQEELRLKENSTMLRSCFIDAALDYRVTGRFEVSAAGRFIVRPQETSERIYADLSYQIGNDPWSLQARLRFQHEFANNDYDETYLRPKLTARHQLSKRWEPFVSAEAFYHVFFFEGNEFDELRLSGGTAYNFDGRHSISGYYMFEREFNKNKQQSNHVVCVSYEWKIY